jgi:hypothetical protein
MQNETYDSRIPRPEDQPPPTSAGRPLSAADLRRRDLPYKLPWLAGFLSGFFPGLGQVYVGYYQHGITLALVFIGIITVLASDTVPGMDPFFGMSLGFVWLYNIIDAARRAQAVNRALDGLGQEQLPADMSLPGSGGSLVGGVVLIVLGGVLLAHLQLDMSLAWLEDWWPLALIGLGGWLVWKARAERPRPDDDG